MRVGPGKHEMVTYQRPKDLKWRVICAGVQRLLKQERLKEKDVSLWVDWQSIYQDDEAEKLKGVVSLIRYATLCQYMLVPTEEAKLEGSAAYVPNRIPAYGSRGWCRIEYFVFGLLAEMRGHEVQLYAITLDGALNRYPEVVVVSESAMPSGGGALQGRRVGPELQPTGSRGRCAAGGGAEDQHHAHLARALEQQARQRGWHGARR